MQVYVILDREGLVEVFLTKEIAREYLKKILGVWHPPSDIHDVEDIPCYAEFYGKYQIERYEVIEDENW